MSEFNELLGKTLIRCEKTGNDRVEFEMTNGEKYALHHVQDCCEDVQIEDICGDLLDLVGEPIIQAEESSNSTDEKPVYADSWTWSFYRIATSKGQVVMRWLGESNGYYSESVDFDRIDKPNDN